MEAIISSGISALATLIVCLITNNAHQKQTEALISYKIDELQKRVDKHNNLIERTYNLEKKTELHEEKIKVANHRLDDLEKGDDSK